ncbi:hypothetical protein [Chitinophaga sp. sic0106]|uniref:hypothetical protein n=1 Tax=Chitinophaga sp. sic0106 TaxID=2854785 RepID=UPI001C44BF63|nr:hypothetical protein [Chitinophaga sp. sic0106]MBV7533229.1 hypothetical protein [Chitinophaga sp. sic0106]
MKLKKLAWLLVCMPTSLFAQNLEYVTGLGNITTNCLLLTGGEKQPTTGTGLLLSYDVGGGGSYVVSRSWHNTDRIPLVFDASKYSFKINNFTRMSITNAGTIGIGTESPTVGYLMDVNGSAFVRGYFLSGGSIESSIASKWVDANGVTQDNGIGGTIRITNPSKDKSGEGRDWVLYNMTGGYGNSLQFWNYDKDGCAGPLCKARMVLGDDGKVGINTAKPVEQLAVNGTILAKRVRVSTNTADWPDYVFADNYQLPSLHTVEAFIREHKHLPEIPSAATIAEKGQDLGEMQKLQMQKIEELTLYIIQQNKLMEAQNKRMEAMEAQLADLKKK